MNIPKLKEREEVLRLWEANQVANDAFEAAYRARDKSSIVAKYDKLRQDLDDQEIAELGFAKLRKAIDAAEEAYDAHSEVVLTDWDTEAQKYKPRRCLITKAVLLDSDETFDDDETGESILRCALNLPPRPAQQETDEDVERAA